MSDPIAAFKVSGFALGFGIVFLYKGLKQLKLRRRAKDIPTSKIDSAAIGDFVEVSAKVVCSNSNMVKAPVSEEEVACFSWNLQYYRKSGRSGSWVNYKSFNSHRYIILNDGGKFNAAVLVSDISISGSLKRKTINFHDRNFQLSDEIKKILNLEKLIDTNKKSSFFVGKKYRIIETCFFPGEEFYVLGTLYSKTTELEENEIAQSLDRKESESELDKVLKRPYIIKKYDKNQNGVLDHLEKEELYKNLEGQLEHLQREVSPDEMSLVIGVFKESTSDLRILDTKKVIVSSSDEKATLLRMGLKAWGQILIGPPLISFGVYYGYKFIVSL